MARPRAARLLALVLCGVVAVIGVALMAAAVYLTYYGKPRVEATASEALGLRVTVHGRVSVGLFPSFHLTLADVHMQARHTELAIAQEAQLSLELIPAIHHRAVLDGVAFKHLQVRLERGNDGDLDLRASEKPPGVTPDLTMGRTTASHASLIYHDQRDDKGFELDDCSIDMSHLRLLPGHPSEDWQKEISFAGKADCDRFTLLGFPSSDVTFSVEAADGVMEFKPVKLRIFGGRANGSVRADYTRQVPRYQTHQQLSAFRLEDFFKTFTPKDVGKGTMSFTTDLSTHGNSMQEWRHTLAGKAALQGENLTLDMGDLDQKFSSFKSSQNFTLVDAAAFFFAGPIGLGVSKGYDYARILQDSHGSTAIRKLVSDWQIDKGIAQATDVAMATNQHRVALHGGLNFGNGQFEDVLVALVDENGCTQASQRVHGEFLKPQLDPPSVTKVVATPTRRLLRKAASLLGKKCVAFYSGSVEPPKKESLALK